MIAFLRSISILLLVAVSMATVSDLYYIISDETITLESRILTDIESGENGESEEQKKEIDDDAKFISFSRNKHATNFVSFDYVFRHTDEIQSKSFKATLIQPPDLI